MGEMDLPASGESVPWWRTRFGVAVFLLSVSAGIVVMCAILLVKTVQTSVPIEIISSESATTVGFRPLQVDVRGAVGSPGVYDIPPDARVEDALQLAGGLTMDAAVEWVDQKMNRAAKVMDGMKIYIPKRTEIETSHNSNAGTGSILTSHNIDQDANDPPSDMVSVNSGSQAELESLPGVGPVTAQAIISGRPYQTLDELVHRQVVKPAVFSKIQSRLSL